MSALSPGAVARPAGTEQTAGPLDYFEELATRAPPKLGEALRHEEHSLALLPFSAPGGAFSGAVFSKAQPRVEAGETGPRIIADLGDRTMSCRIVVGGIDAASALAQRVNSIADAGLDVRWVELRVEATREGAMLGADVIYKQRLPTGAAALGEFKVAAIWMPGIGVICEHDQLGLRKTFFRAVQSIGDSLQAPGMVLQAPARSLYVHRTETREVGFAHNAYSRAPDGVVFSQHLGADVYLVSAARPPSSRRACADATWRA